MWTIILIWLAMSVSFLAGFLLAAMFAAGVRAEDCLYCSLRRSASGSSSG